MFARMQPGEPLPEPHAGEAKLCLAGAAYGRVCEAAADPDRMGAVFRGHKLSGHNSKNSQQRFRHLFAILGYACQLGFIPKVGDPAHLFIVTHGFRNGIDEQSR